jgi:hypothetical protein
VSQIRTDRPLRDWIRDWLSLIIAVGALMVSGFAVYLNSYQSGQESNSSLANGIRTVCVAWAQFVIAEERGHVPDARIDQEGQLFSKARIFENGMGYDEPPDSVPYFCGSAESIHRIRGRSG